MRNYILPLLSLDSLCKPIPKVFAIEPGDRVTVIQNPYNTTARHCMVRQPREGEVEYLQRNPSTNSPWEPYTPGAHATENKPCPVEQFIADKFIDHKGNHTHVERLELDKWYEQLDTVDLTCYHTSPLEDKLESNEMSGQSNRDRGLVMKWGALEVYRVYIAHHGTKIVILRNAEGNEDELYVDEHRCEWLVFDELWGGSQEPRVRDITLEAYGWWGTQRTVLCRWSEIYDHEDGFNQTIMNLKLPEVVLTLRGSVHHPLH